MLQVNYIKENKEKVLELLAIKNFDAKLQIEKILELDTNRREAKRNLDDSLAEANRIAKEIGALMKSGNAEEVAALKRRTAELKQSSKDGGIALEAIEKELTDILVLLPNLPHASVPKGKSSEDNEIVLVEATAAQMNKEALPHWDITSKYDIIDFELGNKITGSGFPVYKGKGARLQRALINFFLDNAVEAGYTEIEPPLAVNEESAYATGQLPDKDGQMYFIGIDKLYMIPTAEVPVTNLYRNMLLKADELPVKCTAYSACFRREAGSYGKDVRGLNRLHQFDKVEIVQIAHPEKSYETLEIMREYVASLLRKLELPFRILKLCGGDLSFTSALTYDMEVFAVGQKKWLEVSSISNFETFQANRLKLRFKDAEGKTQLAHTLNGSALALPRIVAALLEANQTEQGIKIPAALVKYTGFEYIN